MSDMEHNKGKLIPVELDQKYLELDGWDLQELLEEKGLEMIDGQAYRPEWEIKGQDLYGFAYVEKNEDGSIDFNTYHYNGGTHWTEVVERALEKENAEAN